MLKLLVFFILINSCYCLQNSLMNDLTPNEYLLNITYNQMHLKRDQSQFDNELCKEQLNSFVNGLTNQDAWALKMFDSWAKVQSGIISGNTMNFGDFDQCFDTQLKGQYCMMFYKYTDKLSNLNSKTFPSIDLFDLKITSKFAKINGKKFGSGFCMPASCNEDMIRLFVNEQLYQFNLELATDYNQDLFCQIGNSKSSTLPMKPITVVAILIYTTIFILLIGSTIYDLMMRKFYTKEPKKLLIAFSVYTNFNNLFDIGEVIKDDIGCLNGLKVLSLFTTILGHRIAFTIIFPKVNVAEFLNWGSSTRTGVSFWFQLNSVDNFLIIASLLATVKILKALDDQKFKFWKLYVYRYLTNTPTVAFCVIFIIAFSAYVKSGAMLLSEIMANNCKTYWWSTLLHIQNYVNPHDMCMELAWYMSAEFQLMLITPFLIYPAWKYGLKYLLAFPVIISIVNVFIYYEMVRNKLSVSLFLFVSSCKELETFLALIYYPAHTRCIPWLMGILLGFKLHHLRGKKEVINKYIKALLWTLSLGSIVISSFKYVKYNSLEMNTITYVDHALFYVTAKMCWSLSIIWMIFACHNGDGGIIQRFLSSPMWKPVCRMCLTIYFMHFFFLLGSGFELRQPKLFSESAVYHGFLGDAIKAYIGGIIFYLIIQSPFNSLANCCMNFKVKSN